MRKVKKKKEKSLVGEIVAWKLGYVCKSICRLSVV